MEYLTKEVNMTLQYIKDSTGTPVYVVLPIDEYHQLIENNNNTVWVDVPYNSDEFDEVTHPHEIIEIMLEKNISCMAAWRVFRGLTQAQAAQKAGITQAALSQIEKKGTKPHVKTREQFALIYDCSPDQLTF